MKTSERLTLKKRGMNPDRFPGCTSILQQIPSKRACVYRFSIKKPPLVVMTLLYGGVVAGNAT
jgi:hypothetical protein